MSFFSSVLPELIPLASVSVDARMSLGQDAVYQSVGIVVVVGSLAIIALMLVGLNRLLLVSGLIGPAKPAAQSAGITGISAEPSNLPPDVRAAIAAAVYTTMGPSHQIIDIQPAVNPQILAWSMEGRRQIFQSHRVR